MWQTMWNQDWSVEMILDWLGPVQDLREAIASRREAEVLTLTNEINTGTAYKEGRAPKADSDITSAPYQNRYNRWLDTIYPGLRAWRENQGRFSEDEQEKRFRREQFQARKELREVARARQQQSDGEASSFGGGDLAATAELALAGGDAGDGDGASRS